MRVYDEGKSDGVKDVHKKTNDGVKVYHEKDRWGESSPLERAVG